MADQGKKVEVRFGAFTCSIEGYDNPVEQMREILGMMQRMISETPALAEADPDFDASQIQNAMSEDGDGADAGTAPGVVVIRNTSAESESSQDTDNIEETDATDAEIASTSDLADEASEAAHFAGEETQEEPTAAAFAMPEADESDASASEVDQPEAEVAKAEEAQLSEPEHAQDEQSEQVLPDPDPFSFLSRSEGASSGFASAFDNVPEPKEEAAQDLHAPNSADPSAEAESEAMEPVEETQVASAEEPPFEQTEETTFEQTEETTFEQTEETTFEQTEETTFEQVEEPEPEAEPAYAFQGTGTDDLAEPLRPETTTVSNIFAAPKPTERAGFNIFAAPSDHATQESEETKPAATDEPAAEDTRDPIGFNVHDAFARTTEDEPAHTEESPAPEAFETKAARLESEPAPAPAEETPEQARPAKRKSSIFNLRSIFASPEPNEPEPEPEPAQSEQAPPADSPAYQPEPATAASPEPSSSSRFDALLSRVHGEPMIGAPMEAGPGTSPATEVSDDATVTDPGISPAQLATQNGDESVSGQLAAAAAWLTLEKGKSRLTRREVMEVLEQIPSNGPRALADRIKGFGKLVRSGTLILVDDGVFAMAQNERERFQSMMAQIG